MKKIVIILMCLIFALPFGGCGTTDSGTKEEGREILSDSSFKNGFKVSQLLSKNTTTTEWLYSGTVTESPIWFLGQYCDLSTTRTGYDSSKNDLSLGTMFEDGKGIESNQGDVYKLTNVSQSKTVSYNKADNKLSLDLDGRKEYVDASGAIQPRKNGEDWLHLIIQQSAGGVYFDSVKEIWLEIEFEITSYESFDASIGASQFQWIFSIKDYQSTISDYFWFNLPLFDNRYQDKLFEGMAMYDGGKEDATGKFMYAPSGDKYLKEPVKSGARTKVKLELKSLLTDAFNKAKEKGALEQSKIGDMALNSLNIGWEVSNVAKTGLDIFNLSLKVVE